VYQSRLIAMILSGICASDMVEYRLSPRARRDLEDIWLYTKNEWDADQADRYVGLITDKFAAIAEAPLLAPACDHIRPGYRRRRAGRHIIYFRVVAGDVIIMRILHDRMDEHRHL
jgi:toxin ParE1/3/4